MWALKGLFKSVTKRDPSGTESDDSLSGMENETEESNNKTARVFIKNQEELFARKQGNNIKVMSSKRNATSFEGYSSEAKVRKVVAKGEKDQSYSSQSDSKSSKDKDENEEQSAGGVDNRDEDEDEVQDIKSQTRNKFECPLHCGAKVFQLPRHLRNVHRWKVDRARNAVNHFDLRHDQRNSRKLKVACDKWKQKYCIESGRKQWYLSKHLQKQHGYLKGTKQYWMALKASRPVCRWKDSCNRKDVDIESDTVSEINDTTHEKVIMQLNKKREYNMSLKTSLTDKQEIETGSSSSPGDDENTIAHEVQGLEGTEAQDEAVNPDYDEDENGEAEIDTLVFVLTRDSRRTFDKFEKWILSPDGGEKDPKPAALVVRQVQKEQRTLKVFLIRH